MPLLPRPQTPTGCLRQRGGWACCGSQPWVRCTRCWWKHLLGSSARSGEELGFHDRLLQPWVFGHSMLAPTAAPCAASQAVGRLTAPPWFLPSRRPCRLGTPTADVPAKVGDRITVVCAPQRSLFAQRRLLSTAPHGTKPGALGRALFHAEKLRAVAAAVSRAACSAAHIALTLPNLAHTRFAGEALSVSNHTTRSEVPCLRAPPPGGATGGLPSWALPAAVVLTAGDAASSLIDPALPFIAAGAVVATVATGEGGPLLGCMGWSAGSSHMPCKCTWGAPIVCASRHARIANACPACRHCWQQPAAAAAQAAAGTVAGGAGHTAEAAGAGPAGILEQNLCAVALLPVHGRLHANRLPASYALPGCQLRAR